MKPVIKYIVFILCICLLISFYGCDASETDPIDIIDDSTDTDTDTDTDTGTAISIDTDDNAAANQTDTGSTVGYFPIEFTTDDLYGNTITEKSFGEKELFFVYLWATWCPSCVVQFPEMAEVMKEYNDRVGFLGLLLDTDTNTDGAINIIESANIQDIFINTDARDPVMNGLVQAIQTGYVPTTAFITADGDMFEPLVGAHGSQYADIIDFILEGHIHDE